MPDEVNKMFWIMFAIGIAVLFAKQWTLAAVLIVGGITQILLNDVRDRVIRLESVQGLTSPEDEELIAEDN